MELMLKCGFQNIRENFMEIKNNCQIVLEIAQEIKSAGKNMSEYTKQLLKEKINNTHPQK